MLNKIKGARVGAGYSVRDVSNALGITETMYRRKEAGKTKFSIDEFVKLVVFLNLTMIQVDDILFNNTVPVGTFPFPLE